MGEHSTSNLIQFYFYAVTRMKDLCLKVITLPRVAGSNSRGKDKLLKKKQNKTKWA